MGQILYEGMLDAQADGKSLEGEKVYKEPNSVHLSEEWNTTMEDFIDDTDDYQDLNLPNMDDDY